MRTCRGAQERGSTSIAGGVAAAGMCALRRLVGGGRACPQHKRASPTGPTCACAIFACRFQAVLHATAPPAPAYAPYAHGPAALAASPASSAPSAPSSFRVVENNDIKQRPHICLAFRPGSDAAVKQFLAFRLGELRSDAGALSAELERSQVLGGGSRASRACLACLAG